MSILYSYTQLVPQAQWEANLDRLRLSHNESAWSVMVTGTQFRVWSGPKVSEQIRVGSNPNSRCQPVQTLSSWLRRSRGRQVSFYAAGSLLCTFWRVAKLKFTSRRCCCFTWTSSIQTRSVKSEDSLEDQIVVLKPVVSRRISCEELLRFSNIESRSLVGWRIVDSSDPAGRKTWADQLLQIRLSSWLLYPQLLLYCSYRRNRRRQVSFYAAGSLLCTFWRVTKLKFTSRRCCCCFTWNFMYWNSFL